MARSAVPCQRLGPPVARIASDGPAPRQLGSLEGGESPDAAVVGDVRWPCSPGCVRYPGHTVAWGPGPLGRCGSLGCRDSPVARIGSVVRWPGCRVGGCSRLACKPGWCSFPGPPCGGRCPEPGIVRNFGSGGARGSRTCPDLRIPGSPQLPGSPDPRNCLDPRISGSPELSGPPVFTISVHSQDPRIPHFRNSRKSQNCPDLRIPGSPGFHGFPVFTISVNSLNPRIPGFHDFRKPPKFQNPKFS